VIIKSFSFSYVFINVCVCVCVHVIMNAYVFKNVCAYALIIALTLIKKLFSCLLLYKFLCKSNIPFYFLLL